MKLSEFVSIAKQEAGQFGVEDPDLEFYGVDGPVRVFGNYGYERDKGLITIEIGDDEDEEENVKQKLG